jgi:nucleosome assembly protein 1-like 1
MLIILFKVPMIAELIEEWDEPLLKCLIDIKLRLQTEPLIGFTLEFYFNNQSKEYFHNEILTKFYEIQIEPDDELLYYEGTAIVRSIGCQIDWINLTNNLTLNTETGELQSSFFHFFTTSTINDDWKLARDFQIGHYIRENLITKAILYYTGEIFDDDDDYDYEFSDDDEQENSLKEEIGEGEH